MVEKAPRQKPALDVLKRVNQPAGRRLSVVSGFSRTPPMSAWRQPCQPHATCRCSSSTCWS